MSLADLVDRNAAAAPASAALACGERRLSFGELAGRIARAAGWLAGRGVGRGDRVAVLALNDPDTLVLLHACARLGAMLVPLNWRLAPPELAWILADAAPSLLCADAEFAAPAADLAAAAGTPRLAFGEEADAGFAAAAPAASGEGEDADPVLLVYTSGTTGRPKGAILTQDALRANAVMSWHMHGLTSASRVLTVLPFFHVGGLNIQTLPALWAGAAVTIHARFGAAETLAALASGAVTHTVLVPATLAAVAAEPGFAAADLSGLAAVTTGSMVVPDRVVAPFEAKGVPVLQVYGATETCPIAIYTRRGGARPAGSTGWPGLLCEARIAGPDGSECPPGASGEIWIRGPQLTAGYWRNEAATRAAFAPGGWFRTGDVAVRDGSGAFTVHDRLKNVVISGGENVYPAEVERVLLAHPAVAEAAVIGRADPRWGEVPVAHVVLRTGASADAACLDAHVRAELARFKAPKAYLFAESLPKSALGKVQHHLLRERT